MPNILFLIFLEITAVIQASKPRSVNVALETVLEFDNKDDVDFIDTMQSFLEKLKTTITRNRATNDEATVLLDNNNESTKNHFIFTEFLAETVKVLKSYKDDDLKKFFNTLSREVKMWQTRKEFHEITNKLGFRRIIDRNLLSLKNSPVREIRKKLNTLSDTLNFESHDRNTGFITNFLNYFYKKESEANLLNFLNNLKLYRSGSRRKNMTDLKRIIRNGITTIIEPLLKLNSNTISDINTIYYKYIANNSDTKHGRDLLKHIKKHDNTKISRHKHHNVLKENEILDYIENHVKIIGKHLTTTGFLKAKVKSLPKLFKSTGTTYKYSHTTRSKKNKKLKTKQGSLGRLVMNLKKNQKNSKLKGINNTSAIGVANDRKPVLIKLTRNHDSELKSVEEYLSSTSKRQKRYKKKTKRNKTPKKQNVYLGTTKKFRKAFRTTTLSAEGLSIEHFGSLFGKEFHRKSNDNDTFVQTVLNTSNVQKVPNDATFIRDESDSLSQEMRSKNNFSRENEEYLTGYHDEMRNMSDSIEETNANTTVIVDETQDIITESIKIKGNITIQKPTVVTSHSNIEITSSKPVNNVTGYRNFNVSIVTKYFNIKPMKPTNILRRQDMETVNGTEMNTTTISTLRKTTITSIDPINNSANESDLVNINIKRTDDGLENEIEGVMDKYNKTPIPVEFKNYLKNVQINSGENSKVKDQMQADLAKLLATPSTKTTVTALFTDPFDDIDNAADIL